MENEMSRQVLCKDNGSGGMFIFVCNDLSCITAILPSRLVWAIGHVILPV